MAHNGMKKHRENVTLFDVYFIKSKAGYSFKKTTKQTLIFNEKQLYLNMVKHRQGQKKWFCLFQDGSLSTG